MCELLQQCATPQSQVKVQVYLYSTIYTAAADQCALHYIIKQNIREHSGQTHFKKEIPVYISI